MTKFCFSVLFIGVVAGGIYCKHVDELNLATAPRAPIPNHISKVVFETKDNDAILLDGKKLTEKLVSIFGEVESSAATLEIARFNKLETMSLKGEESWLGENITDISGAISYGYKLPLDDSWKIDVIGTKLVAHTPDFHAQHPAAINLQVKTKRGWAKWGTNEHQQVSVDHFINNLETFSNSPEYRSTAKEIGRKNVEQFLRIWILGAASWGSQIEEIEVIFPTESRRVGDLSDPETSERSSDFPRFSPRTDL